MGLQVGSLLFRGELFYDCLQLQVVALTRIDLDPSLSLEENP